MPHICTSAKNESSQLFVLVSFEGSDRRLVFTSLKTLAMPLKSTAKLLKNRHVCNSRFLKEC